MGDKLSENLRLIQEKILKMSESKKPLDVNKLNNLLNQKFKTELERSNIKKQLNLITSYQWLISKYTWEGKFNSKEVDELMKWQYDSEEDINEVKLTVKSKDTRFPGSDKYGSDAFMRKELLNLWIICYLRNEKDSKKAEVECLRFLKWFFEADEKVDSYRKEKLVENENFIKEFAQGNSKIFKFELQEEFFKFCAVTPEKVKEIKTKMRDNVNDWIEFFAYRQGSVRLADDMLTWICPDKKVEAIQEFLHSDYGPYIIAMVVNSLDGKIYNKNIMILFNQWIKGNIDIKRVRSDLSDCDYNMLKMKYICLLDAFLDILEKGKEIKDRDIDICVKKYIIQEKFNYVHKSDDDSDETTEDEDLDSEDENSSSEGDMSEDGEDEDEDMPEDD